MERTYGYLYSIKNNTLVIKEGYIVPCKNLDGSSAKLYITCSIDFDRRDRNIEHRNCTINPGECYHDTLWLERKDDKLAIELFVKYEEERIEKLKQSINKCEQKIERIRGFI